MNEFMDLLRAKLTGNVTKNQDLFQVNFVHSALAAKFAMPLDSYFSIHHQALST